jgi:hypothetical protein
MSSRSDPSTLSLAGLPPELATNALQAFGYPVIPLVPDGQPLGSGVLVEVDGVSGILTAEHVVFSDPFQRATALWTIPNVYLTGSLNQPTTHFNSSNIRTDLLRCYPETPQRQNHNAEWGPDLAFIRLPRESAFEQRLRAVRINFYPLARDPEIRLQQALDENKSLLAITGIPGELSQELPPTPHDRQSIVTCLTSLVPRFEYQLLDNGDDFFTAPVEPGAPELLIRQSFAGVSGGAVWRLVNLFEQDAAITELRSSDYVLAGIAFWQDPDHSLHSSFVPTAPDRSIKNSCRGCVPG